MELPVVTPPSTKYVDTQPLYPRGEEGGLPIPTQHNTPPPKPKVPNIYVKKPHRKQPALGLFLAKPDPEDQADWRFGSGNLGQNILYINEMRVFEAECLIQYNF